jgi:hypothetical protein
LKKREVSGRPQMQVYNKRRGHTQPRRVAPRPELRFLLLVQVLF